MSNITWRTVIGRSLAEAAAPMEAARRSLNAGFDRFSKVLSDRQAINDSNEAAVKTNAKQAVVEQLQGVQSPEELAALRASPGFQAQKSALDAEGRNQIFEAGNQQRKDLRQEFIDSTKYDRFVTDEENAQAVDQLKTDALRGDMGAVTDGFIANPTIRNKSAILATALKAEKDQRQEGRTVENHELGISGKKLNQAGQLQDLGFAQNREMRAEENQGIARKRLELAERGADRADRSTDSTLLTQALTRKGIRADQKQQARDREIGNTEQDRSIALRDYTRDLVKNTRLAEDTDNQNAKRAVSSIFKDAGVSVGADGRADFSGLSIQQKRDLDEQIQASEANNIKTISQRRQEIINKVLDKGGTQAEGLAAANEYDRSAAISGIIDNKTRQKLETQSAELKKQEAKIKAENPFYSNPAEAVEHQGKIAATINKIFKDDPEGATAVRSSVASMMNEGIPITIDGKTTVVKVPPKIMESAVQLNADTDQNAWFLDGFYDTNTPSDLQEYLKKVLSSKESAKQLEEAYQVQQGYADLKVKTLKAQAQNAGGTVDSISLSKQLRDSLKSSLPVR